MSTQRLHRYSHSVFNRRARRNRISIIFAWTAAIIFLGVMYLLFWNS